jgi:broad specificity phosphatase PhoE
MPSTFIAAFLVLATAATVSAQGTIFVVRHAERADTGTAGATTMATDPDLSAPGKARADALAMMLKDAGIKAIYTTEYKRTQQTAAPLAKALGIQATVVPAREMKALTEKLRASTENALVVGHSNTVGETIAALGVAEPVKVGDADYDNLFIVLRGEKPTLVRLHFR